ncbi:MAG: amidohydrolase/deacetylase family metallohydrolase [Candidatus Latescibacteria bacterium]|nr:amidohydrolase/deacetylase family metallohydrolase [Candidatus Latescibacterota bacterium]
MESVPEEVRLDLLLKDGYVIDPANDVEGIRDVGIRDGKIAEVSEDIVGNRAEHVIDVSGLLVTPGLVDIHVHAYDTRLDPGPGKFTGSLNADAYFLSDGVTTCVDTGTAGCDEISHFRRTVMETKICRILAFVNISAPGMGSSEQDIRTFDAAGAASAATDHRDVVVGIKTAHYWPRGPFDADHPPWASVEGAVEAGALCGMPVMVDFWPRPPERSYPELILRKLRPGDIHTHVFARQFPVVDARGKVRDYMFKARERGVWFDLGHGAASFWYRNGVPAIADGFPPDSISTDLHTGNIRGSVVRMTDTMSKCLLMGMPLQEVIYRSTAAPARAIQRPDLGTLAVGAEADVAVLTHLRGAFSFRDCGWGRMDGNERLACKLTLRKGEVVWDSDALTVAAWKDLPKDYWETTIVPVPIQRHWR